MRRGQGLPLNTIILAILALLVLVFIVLFATGAFGTLFGQTKSVAGATETDIVAAQTKCSQWCLQAQGVDTTAEWEASRFCKEELLDKNGDGTADSCKDLGMTCSTTVEEGEVDETSCPPFITQR